jgi:hypothetical protein
VKEAHKNPALAGECLEAFADRDSSTEERRLISKAGARLLAEGLSDLRRIASGNE